MSGEASTPSPSSSRSLFTSSSSSTTTISRDLIKEDDSLLIKLPSGVIKPVKLNKNSNNTLSLGKLGSFKAKELVGRVYGQTYEILEGGQLEAVKATLNEIEETAANNEHITSTGAQNLTFVDIKALKESGATGREIIQKQIEEHKAYELKTEYSKEKYLKRKEAKYIPLFTPLPCSIHSLTTYHSDRVPAKTREIRADTMANLLAMANVRPGSRVLIVENAGGLVVGGCIERMGGTGTLMIINDADSPPDLHILETFNFAQTPDLDPIRSIHWAATEPDWTPPDLPLEANESGESPVPESKMDEVVEEGKTEEEKEREFKRLRNLRNKNQRELNKLKKRKSTFDKARLAREEFFRGEYDALIVASEYEPYSIVERLIPFLAGSASIVIHSPTIQPLFPCLMSLRANPLILQPTIHEPFLRRYQVLPGRTHPEMAGLTSGGGFLLSCLRVVDQGGVNSVKAGSSRGGKRVSNEDESGAGRKKQKTEMEKTSEPGVDSVEVEAVEK
ncbi:tRNA 1-methyladenosine methyltransferase subunit GCD10 [Sporobolomyces salmoneus]|uniref:tRNA 1-methyladenosine methyltransferase subunit GCD10 n=1 Tax=Sporobolomyces salmoneus TaxID=183962 RepID=UPI00317FD3E2